MSSPEKTKTANRKRKRAYRTATDIKRTAGYMKNHLPFLKEEDYLIPDVGVTPWSHRPGFMAISVYAFSADFHLPLHPSIAAILRSWNLAAGQLCPTAWRVVMGTCLLCFQRGVRLSVELMNSLCRASVFDSSESQGFAGVSRAVVDGVKPSTVMRVPEKDFSWSKWWVYLRIGDDMGDIPTQWTQLKKPPPPAAALGEGSTLRASMEKLFFRDRPALDKYPLVSFDALRDEVLPGWIAEAFEVPPRWVLLKDAAVAPPSSLAAGNKRKRTTTTTQDAEEEGEVTNSDSSAAVVSEADDGRAAAWEEEKAGKDPRVEIVDLTASSPAEGESSKEEEAHTIRHDDGDREMGDSFFFDIAREGGDFKEETSPAAAMGGGTSGGGLGPSIDAHRASLEKTMAELGRQASESAAREATLKRDLALARDDAGRRLAECESLREQNAGLKASMQASLREAAELRARCEGHSAADVYLGFRLGRFAAWRAAGVLVGDDMDGARKEWLLYGKTFQREMAAKLQGQPRGGGGSSS